LTETITRPLKEISMLRHAAIIGLLPLLLAVTPAAAVTKEQKMETCTFGADNPKLEGAKRKAFIAKCMANRDDKRGPVKRPANEMAPGTDKKG
jgi:hypothetical protein